MEATQLVELGAAALFWLLAGALASRATRVAGAGWAAGAFAGLALILSFIVVQPAEGSRWETTVTIVQLVSVAVIPLFLYRFTAALTPLSARWHRVAYATTSALCAGAVMLSLFGVEEDSSTPLRIYLLTLLVQWTWLSVISLKALWSTSSTLPSIARVRVRFLAFAVGLLNVALASAVSVEDTDLTMMALVLATTSALGFFLAFLPPPWLRAIWRRPEQAGLDAALRDLVSAVDENAIAEKLLPHVIKIVGADRAELVDPNGISIAAEEAKTSRDIDGPPDCQSRPIDVSATLRVWVPATTPLFAAEELTLLETLGTMTDLALERARLLRAERDKRVSLGKLADQLQKTNSALETEVQERQDAERQANESRVEAERANNAKSEFLSRMSHELRTPLNSILGFAQLLEDDELTPDQLDSVDHILKGGRHLLGLINEVLDISRIESGKMTVSPEPVDVIELIGEVGDMMRPAVAERDIDLSFELDRLQMRHVVADRQRLKQILINLVSNAVKYNRRAGLVKIAAESHGDRVTISVSDTGPGIAQARLERLFIPFDRLGADGTVEGTGLGLALSKGLAELMGGFLEASSTVGEGSTFVVGLQSADVPHPADEDLLLVQGTGGSEEIATILYIEDNLTNVKLVERILGAYPGLKLLTAMQARTGLDLARHHGPDLILLDLHLPDVEGDTVLKQLRAEPKTRASKIVILSADATPGRIERLKEAGADDYLTKPIDVARFREVVEASIGART